MYGNIHLVNEWVFVVFSLHRACEIQQVILLHPQYPIFRISFDRDTSLKVCQGIVSCTGEIFVAITQFSFRLRYGTRISDFPDEFSVISPLDGLLKKRKRQFDNFFWTNIFHIYSSSTYKRSQEKRNNL